MKPIVQQISLKLATISRIRVAAMAMAFAGPLCLAASDVSSLQPFVTDKEAVFDGGLVGAWKDDEQEGTIIIRQEGEAYAIDYVENDDTYHFKAGMFDVGGVRFLDLTDNADSLEIDLYYVKVHCIIRIWIEGSNLRFAFLSSDWIKEQAAREFPTQLAEGWLITARGEAVRAFLLNYATYVDAYNPDAVAVLHRTTGPGRPVTTPEDLL